MSRVCISVRPSNFFTCNKFPKPRVNRVASSCVDLNGQRPALSQTERAVAVGWAPPNSDSLYGVEQRRRCLCTCLLYKYENRKLPSYCNGMFVLQHDNVVIRPRRIHRTPQHFNITEEILPYNNVCNFKIKHTNSKFCRLCIRYKIPELIKDNYFPKIVLEKMYTHSYSGFTKYAKTYTISKYKATCKIRNCYVCKQITNTAV